MRPSIPGWLAVTGIAVIAGSMIGVVALVVFRPVTPSASTCQRAAISQRAAQICSTELVGCSLTFEQVKQVIAEQEAAKGCK